jgi:predicted nucleic acid-binding protein
LNPIFDDRTPRITWNLFGACAEHEVDSRLVLELVRDSDCSAYDCEFVALAMALGVKLVTMDAKLLKAFPKYAVALSVG